jgi:mono/diheme cytochrome c family protein
VTKRKSGLGKVKDCKPIVIAFCVVAATLACSVGKPQRYVIAQSKAYEASLFRQNCAICHGPEGEGKTLDDGRRIPNLREGEFKYTTDEQIYRHIAEGGNGMTPFRGQLTEKEINMMVRFVQDQLRRPSNR